jgi:hypothetical protein
MSVTQISGENGHAPFDVDTAAVPLHQRLNDESVAKIMKTRPVAVGHTSKADLA